MTRKLTLTIPLFVFSLFVCTAFAAGQDPGKSATATPVDAKAMCIPRNSKIYVTPMQNGFETYMVAALHEKKVPLIVVTKQDDADFVMTGSADESKRAGWAKIIFMNDGRPSESASITVVNAKTNVVVFADASDRVSANRGKRSTSEKLAKYLGKKIEKDQAVCTQ